MASFQAAATPGYIPGVFVKLGLALLFAGVYVFGGRANQVFGEPGLRRFHSVAAGIAVSYVFVHIMPELHGIREVHLRTEPDYIRRFFPESSVYLAAMLGFLGFYGLESLVSRPARETGRTGKCQGEVGSRQAWMHILGFCMYTWLITFQIGQARKPLVPLLLFAVAMGLHIAPIANRLRGEYRATYEPRGAALLALSSLTGCACGLMFDLPGSLALDMVAIVAGGVIVNTAIGELPKERKASFWFFFAGTAAYTALLLALSHFEEGGHP